MNWSFSSLKDFEQCPRRYNEVRILKNYEKEDTEQSLYGDELHAAAESYVRTGTMGEAFYFMKAIIDALLTKAGTKIPEAHMALSVQLEPCPWNDPNVWVRGIADLLILDEPNHMAWLVDYKTGSNKYPDKDQLDLMSLLVFAHYPSIVQVNSALIFVHKDTFIKHKRYLHESDVMWWSFRNRLAKLEKAMSVQVWNPKQSGLCKKHCPVLTCEFNGRNQ